MLSNWARDRHFFSRSGPIDRPFRVRGRFRRFWCLQGLHLLRRLRAARARSALMACWTGLAGTGTQVHIPEEVGSIGWVAGGRGLDAG